MAGRRTAAAAYWAGRATLVRRPEDLAGLRPGVRRLLAPAAPGRAQVLGAAPPPITLALDLGDDDTRRATRPTRTSDDDGDESSPCRCAPGAEVLTRQGLRRLHRRASWPRPDPADGQPAVRHLPPRQPAPLVPAKGHGRPARPAPHRALALCATGGEPMRRRLHRAGHPAPPAGAAPRRVGLDGALRPGPAPLRPRRRRVGRCQGGGVRARHPADPAHPASSPAAIPTPRSAGPSAPGARTGPAAPGWARACGSSTTTGACGAWPGERWW